MDGGTEGWQRARAGWDSGSTRVLELDDWCARLNFGVDAQRERGRPGVPADSGEGGDTDSLIH